jgi:hypothetical protein
MIALQQKATAYRKVWMAFKAAEPNYNASSVQSVIKTRSGVAYPHYGVIGCFSTIRVVVMCRRAATLWPRTKVMDVDEQQSQACRKPSIYVEFCG